MWSCGWFSAQCAALPLFTGVEPPPFWDVNAGARVCVKRVHRAHRLLTASSPHCYLMTLLLQISYCFSDLLSGLRVGCGPFPEVSSCCPFYQRNAQTPSSSKNREKFHSTEMFCPNQRAGPLLLMEVKTIITACCVSWYSITKNRKLQLLKSYFGAHIFLFFSTAQRIYCCLGLVQQDPSEFLSITDSLFPSYASLSPKLLDTQCPHLPTCFSGLRWGRKYGLPTNRLPFLCKIKFTTIIILMFANVNTNI